MPDESSGRGKPIYAVYWLGISVVVLALDFAVGPVIQFPALFIIPVSLAAWYNGRARGLVLAVALPLVRLYFTTIADTPWSFAESATNAAIRIGVLGAFAMLVDRSAAQTQALSLRVEKLKDMLPTCEVCRRVRGRGNRWQSLEDYLHADLKDLGTSEVCPECAKHYRESFDRR